MQQTTDTVVMVRPARFTYNEETATNNAFQQVGYTESAQRYALEEFDNFVGQLRSAGVNVIVAEDSEEPHTPDSIFPNNWFSAHSGKELEEILSPQEMESGCTFIVLYPMYAKNRRFERGKDAYRLIREHYGNNVKIIDLTGYEEKNLFLEGTGSLILDRENRIAYACLSERTSEEVLDEWSGRLGYDYFLFSATDGSGAPIYHTNVMMSIGTRYAVVCLDAINDIEERMMLIEELENSDKEIIEISLEQMESFAGNMLELKGKDSDGKPSPVIVMSESAYKSLDNQQLFMLEKYATIVVPDLHIIEANGGGSARCMVAELF